MAFYKFYKGLSFEEIFVYLFKILWRVVETFEWLSQLEHVASCASWEVAR